MQEGDPTLVTDELKTDLPNDILIDNSVEIEINESQVDGIVF